MAEITIRPCRPDEYQIILDTWQDSGNTPSPTDTVDALKQLSQKDNDLLLVAELDNRIVGTIMGGWDGWRGNIYRLAVLPEFRRRGIGRAMVKEIEKRLADKGARKMSICVIHEQDSAVVFWNALKDDGYERDYRIIRYAKPLKP